MCNPFTVVDKFEQALCNYTGAKYAVATTSCTMAILLACRWFHKKWRRRARISIPTRTYVGVPQSVLHAGLEVEFRVDFWKGEYQLKPLPVWDSARRFTSDMFRPGHMQCLSFHWSKILGIGQGGAILHDDVEADDFLRRIRFDGRRTDVPAKEDVIEDLGYHAYMMPRDAAEGLTRLRLLPKQNADLPNSDYPDLSTFKIFQ